MAKCFDVTGYIEPCNTVRQKYTGRALLITGLLSSGDVSIIFSSDGLKVNSIGGVDVFDSLEKQILYPLIIDAQNPFGVTIQGNTDSGRVMYTKTIPVSIPATRDCRAEEFIMGLQKGLYGTAIVVLESYGLDKENDKKDNDIFGAYSPVRLDPTSVTRSEYENGGAWSFNLVCEEPVPNVVCVMPGLEVAIDKLNA